MLDLLPLIRNYSSLIAILNLYIPAILDLLRTNLIARILHRFCLPWSFRGLCSSTSLPALTSTPGPLLMNGRASISLISRSIFSRAPHRRNSASLFCKPWCFPPRTARPHCPPFDVFAMLALLLWNLLARISSWVNVPVYPLLSGYTNRSPPHLVWYESRCCLRPERFQ